MHADLPTDVIFIGGRSGVGKSTVAFEASRILAAADIRHAVIEGDNLDQAHPQPWRSGIDLAARNLRAMWANYRALGYAKLLFTNTVSVLEVPTLSEALGGEVRATPVLLVSSDATATARLERRETGSSLEAHLDRSERAARRLDAEATGAIRIATDGRTPSDLATEMLTLAGWLRAG
ncbi:adenylyl-sulfate kinase [Microbacterium stercoris]|uniref:Adenylyl-sulfate kinase n=1 Tax=Microbacterium stercoris TaxID=2820289 RepID=A0A939QHT2_9MICO|nr:adenylyl-sulfate kinase [Microbacterium stercoris]MBO3663093.1 adenylyl-sulfate kinase [Microbacterium stercoris]